jgi:hypothetical protein
VIARLPPRTPPPGASARRRALRPHALRLPAAPAAARTVLSKLPGLAVLTALAVLAGLAGCVGDASSGPAPTADLLGGWVMEPTAACRESLTFRADGSFAQGVALSVAGWPAGQHGEGLLGAAHLDADGNVLAQLQPQGVLPEALLAYCASWSSAAHATLPFAAVAQAGGPDPATLAWRPVNLPGGGQAWVGTDADAGERFALVRDGDTLRGFAPDAAGPLFHRTPLALPTQLVVDSNPYAVLNLPQHALARHYVGLSPGESLGRLLLSVHSAVELTVSVVPGADPPPLCELVVWSSPGFNTGTLQPNPLGQVAAVPQVELNPADAGGPLVPYPYTVNSVTETLYLLPVQVVAPDAGPCDVNLRARPLVAKRTAEHLADAQAVDAFTVPLGAAPAYLLGFPAGAPGALRALPLQGAPAWDVPRPPERLAQPAQGGADALGLLDGAAHSVRLAVQTVDVLRYLSVFPDGSVSGLGPFAAYAPAPAPAELALPGTLPVSLSNESQLTVRFTLGAAALVRLYSDGGAETSGSLLDARGTQLAAARGGAPDGVGFRIEAALAPGSYDLLVQPAALPADFTLHGELPASAALDASLAACLLAAGQSAAPPAALRSADCGAQAIAGLDGIAAYGSLQALRLDDNPLTSLLPLADLTELRVLSLDGTAPASLAPLTGLPVLYRLALRRATLGPAAPGQLASLTTLTALDLRDATGLDAAAVTALKAALPNTRIVAPDGTVLD